MSGPIRTSIGLTRTRLANYIAQANNLLGEQGQQTEQSVKEILLKIKNAINTLDGKISDWSELMIMADAVNRVREEQEFTNYLNNHGNFIELIDQGREMIDNLENWLQQKHQTLAIQIHDNKKQRVHLPKLTLPQFDGQFKNWMQFWSIFEASIDSDKTIPEVQKLAYLLSCMKDDAEIDLKGYTVTVGNYKIVKDHLIKRFGDMETFKSNLYKELGEIHSKTPKTIDVRKMTSECTRILNQLEQAGENVNVTVIQEIIMEKFPRWLLLEIIQEKRTIAEFNTTKLMELADKILKQREMVWQMTKENDSSRIDE